MEKIWTKERLLTLILVFFITGLWDIILRVMANGNFSFLGIEKMKWVTVLRGYFEKHTILSAALLAAFVGAIAYVLIVYTLTYLNITNYLQSLLIVFLISGLIGFPMRYSGLFPVLYNHYYKPLGLTYSFITDGMSGVIVAITLFCVQYVSNL
jgi:hypothetical protein